MRYILFEELIMPLTHLRPSDERIASARVTAPVTTEHELTIARAQAEERSIRELKAAPIVNAGSVLYDGRVVPEKGFRAFIYSANNQKKLVNSWQEYQAHILSGCWFSHKTDLSAHYAAPAAPASLDEELNAIKKEINFIVRILNANYLRTRNLLIQAEGELYPNPLDGAALNTLAQARKSLSIYVERTEKEQIKQIEERLANFMRATIAARPIPAARAATAAPDELTAFHSSRTETIFQPQRLAIESSLAAGPIDDTRADLISTSDLMNAIEEDIARRTRTTP